MQGGCGASFCSSKFSSFIVQKQCLVEVFRSLVTTSAILCIFHLEIVACLQNQAVQRVCGAFRWTSRPNRRPYRGWSWGKREGPSSQKRSPAPALPKQAGGESSLRSEEAVRGGSHCSSKAHAARAASACFEEEVPGLRSHHRGASAPRVGLKCEEMLGFKCARIQGQLETAQKPRAPKFQTISAIFDSDLAPSAVLKVSSLEIVSVLLFESHRCWSLRLGALAHAGSFTILSARISLQARRLF